MEQIREQIKTTIKGLYGLDVAPDITPSPENIDADYSSNVALKLAKDLRKAPMEIANEIAYKISAKVSAPGFLNFTLPNEYLAAQIKNLSTNFRENISSDEYSGKTVICEFSDPNPFKVLHVGHLYTSIIGDSKTLYILEQKSPADFTIEDIAKCYVEGTAAYEDNEDAHARITELNKKIYQINSENFHDSKLAELYWKGRELSYDYFKDFYAQIGVHFDKFYPESTTELKKGVYEISDGAVIFNGEKFGLHTRVFINKEGVPTYETKDVGLIFTKWQDYHFDKSVVITGSEQLDYMKVVLKSVEQYAPDLVEKTTHLTHGLVKLPGNVKMSSRKGNFLKAVDVLNMVRDELQNEYNSTDNTVALAATKYAFLKYKMGGHIIFDPKESVKMTGNSGPYLLYACVRAKKILASVNDAFEEHISQRGKYGATEAHNDGPEGAFRKSIFTDAERNLAKKILEYKGTLKEAVAEMAPHKVASYLYELAQEFSRFYEHCPVAGSDMEAERTELVKVYLDTMSHGLNILGINIPEEM